MNIKDINKLSEMAYYYPYMGIFTNNPNDVRSLEFLYYFNSNNFSKLTTNNHLKYEYYVMFKDAYEHLDILDNILNNGDIHLSNYNLKKWFYDFIFTPMIDEYDSFFKWPANLPTKETYVDLLQDQFEDISNLDIFDVDEVDESINEIIELINNFRSRLDIYISYFSDYIDSDNNIIPIIPFPKSNKNKLDSSNLTKFIEYSDEVFQTIKNINNLLNSKYIRFLELKEFFLNNDVPSMKEDVYCFNSILNIDLNKCDEILDVILKEKEYGPLSKKFFRNKEYFKIFDNLQINAIQENINGILNLFLKKLKFKKKQFSVYFNEPIKRIIIYESDLNIELIDSNIFIEHEVFKNYKENDIFYIILNDLSKNLIAIKIILTEKITDKKCKFYTDIDLQFQELSTVLIIDNNNLINPGRIDLNFYEDIESWKKNQNIDKELNDNDNLMEFLNTIIYAINKSLYTLNPQFNFLNENTYTDDSKLITKNYYKLIYKSIKNINLNNALKTDIRRIYEKLTNLSLGIKYDRIKENFEPSNLFNIINLPDFEKNIVIYNLTNSIGIFNSFANNPSNKNLELLTSILNLSNQFYKNV